MATYYVMKGVSGASDSNNGLYATYLGGTNGPWLTLGRADGSTLAAGDTLYIGAGTYQEVLDFTTDGTEANPITITNYGEETVIIDGNNHALPAADYDCLVDIQGDWYTVSNLEISYAGWYGIGAHGSHCTFYNIYCHHTWGAGINLWGSYGLMDTCRGWYNSMRYEYGVGDNWSTSLSIMGPGADYCTIKNCIAWDTWGQGIKCGSCYYGTLEDNISYNNWYNYYIKNTQHSLIQRNISYCTEGNLMLGYPGIASQVAYLVGDEVTTPLSSDNIFINNFGFGGRFVLSIGTSTMENCLYAYNVFMNCDDYYTTIRYTVKINEGTYTNARFLNNIIIQDDALPIALNAATGINFGYNCWTDTPPVNCQGTGDIYDDPDLARTGPITPGNLTSNYFKILYGSPCIGTATVLADALYDYFGTLRGADPDIGAHEYITGTDVVIEATPNVVGSSMPTATIMGYALIAPSVLTGQLSVITPTIQPVVTFGTGVVIRLG